ncbi:hypothetical protein HPB49_004662 [Dermacentor silvarum]|uniref:Uncharacterized protein n=1 Tax=Dermacentor silvarum TaxID=543639 RepID=A0ACB8C242_DERSI|nr:hypothetical protein HPB49_004662 [Dermacentor silvarum]
MLDSLVRVSRRVGWVTYLLAANHDSASAGELPRSQRLLAGQPCRHGTNPDSRRRQVCPAGSPLRFRRASSFGPPDNREKPMGPGRGDEPLVHGERVVSPDLRSTTDTSLSPIPACWKGLDTFESPARTEYDALPRPSPNTELLIDEAGRRFTNRLRACGARAVAWQTTVSEAQTPPRHAALAARRFSGRRRTDSSLAEGIVSCGVAPAPTGVAQSFRGRDCEALGPTADYDGTLQLRQRAKPTLSKETVSASRRPFRRAVFFALADGALA